LLLLFFFFFNFEGGGSAPPFVVPQENVGRSSDFAPTRTRPSQI